MCMCIYMSACMYVYVCERERKGEKKIRQWSLEGYAILLRVIDHKQLRRAKAVLSEKTKMEASHDLISKYTTKL